VAEWIRLAEQKPAELQSAQLAPNEKSKRRDGRGHRKEGGIRAASRELGIDRDAARRAVQVASLSSEAKDAARETGLDDNRSALLKAASAPPEKQAEAIKQAAAFKPFLTTLIKPSA
jgi:hypothetical protein